MRKYQSWLGVNQRWISTVIKSSVISSEVAPNSAEIFNAFWISAEQRWKTSYLWNSAEYLSDFNPDTL